MDPPWYRFQRNANQPYASLGLGYCAAMVRAMIDCVVFAARSRSHARKTGARAGQCDQAGQDRAKKRKKDNSLIHSAPNPSSG